MKPLRRFYGSGHCVNYGAILMDCMRVTARGTYEAALLLADIAAREGYTPDRITVRPSRKRGKGRGTIYVRTFHACTGSPWWTPWRPEHHARLYDRRERQTARIASRP